MDSNVKLCPVQTLELYLKATEDKRSPDETRLFSSYRKPYSAVTTTSIGRWLKETLPMAGIGGFTAHSTRAASASAAKGKGVSVTEILKAGSWSRKSTFHCFYDKLVDTPDDSMTRLCLTSAPLMKD